MDAKRLERPTTQNNINFLIIKLQNPSAVFKVLQRTFSTNQTEHFSTNQNSARQIISREWNKLDFIDQIIDLLRVKTWLVQSKLLANQPVEKLHENSSPQRQHVRARLPLEESRNPIVTGLVQSLFVRSVVTRNRPSCWSASCPSSVLCEKSLRILRPICDSRVLLWWLFKRPARLTLLVCLKTPTCAPSTPSASPSCPRTFSWPAESAENEHKRIISYQIKRLL